MILFGGSPCGSRRGRTIESQHHGAVYILRDGTAARAVWASQRSNGAQTRSLCSFKTELRFMTRTL